MADTSDDFRREMLQLGIISYNEQDTLWDIAKKCARTAGIPAAGGGMVLGMGAGAVPGALVGMLAGLATGTAACTAANAKHRSALRTLLDEQ